jgi:anti-sigma factor RsiW
MQSVDPPPGLMERARQKVESESRPLSFKLPKLSWKTAVPALSMAALVLIVMLNPFAGQLQTVDEMVALSIANHADTNMKMTFRAGDVGDIDQWFTQWLEYALQLPDLSQLGLNLMGGRKCSFGKIDAALVLCKSKGKRVSLFAINQNDVGLSFDNQRVYTVEEGDYKVRLWKDSGMVYAMVI